MRRPSWKKVLLVGTGSVVLSAGALVGVGYAMTDVPEPNEEAVQQATIIRYAGGEELARIGAQNRILVDLEDVSLPAQHAVLAAEDRGFYTEPGISPRGILRALFANVSSGGVQQGASTITQQYAKNAFLTSDRTFSRKVKEVFIALKMTQTRDKDQILEDYLNTTYFGQRAADRLSIAQAAVLASSIRSPAAYDPTRHPERARERWEYVLDGMVDKGWITQEERDAQTYPFVRGPGQNPQQDRSGPKGYVIDRVEDELAANGFSEARLSRGGLVVQTTLRKGAQEAAVAAVQEEVPAPDLSRCGEDDQDCRDAVEQEAIQGALVAVKPGTGEVFAYYGGRTGNGGFDYASHDAPQDPGSTMKPYVLAAALEEGISLRTRFNGNSPREFEGYPRPVRNFDDEDYGRIDLTTATANSVNTVYVALAQEVGPQKVADLAHRAGIGEDVPLADENGDPALGIALGIYGVPVIDQANGFATFAANGVASRPFLVKSVVEASSRESVYTAEVSNERAFGEDVSADATYAMQQVVEDGSARRNGRLEDGRPAAGKTGTTQESNDAWMVGFTPQLSTAVWIGRGNNEPIVGELGSEGGLTGGSAPTRIWKAFMDAAHEGLPQEEFPERAFVGSSRSVDGGGGGGSDDDGVTRRRDDDEDEQPEEEAPAPEEEQTAAPEPSAPAEEPEPAPEPPAPEPEPSEPPAEPPPPEPEPSEPPAEPAPPAEPPAPPASPPQG